MPKRVLLVIARFVVSSAVGGARRTALSVSPLVLLGRFLFALRVSAEARQ